MHTSGTTSGSPQVEWRPDPAAYELSRVELSDEAVFRSAVEAAGRQSWLHYFPFLYCFSTSNTPLRWEKCDASVCLYILKSIGDKQRLQLYVPPFPFTQNALAAAFASCGLSRVRPKIWKKAATSSPCGRVNISIRAIS